MARLYTNENFPLPAAEALRRLGHDVLTTQEAGNTNQAIPDEAVMDFARQEDRILLTLNRKHFIRLHHLRPNHAGMIVCTYDPDSSALAARIHAVLDANPSLAGLLMRVNRSMPAQTTSA